MACICYRQVFAGKLREATMIHQWKKALLDGAAKIFGRGGKKAPEVDEDIEDQQARFTY
jgi:hypothetical protein